MKTFSLPPDTRAPRQGDPPGDTNAVVDAITALGALYSALNENNGGGADNTGGADVAQAINAASAAGVALLPPGTFLLNTATALTGPIRGSGMGLTTLQIGSSFSGTAAIAVTADAVEVTDLGIVGASGTTTSNPACNGIEITGSGRAKVRDVWFKNINGYCLEVAATASKTCVDFMASRLVGRNCAGGVHDLGVTGTSFLGEHFFTDLQFQQMGVTTGANANLDVVLIEDVSDVLVQGLNAGCATSTIGGTVHVKGACSTIRLTNLDVGAQAASSAAPSILIESGSNGTPNDVQVTASRCGGGGVGTRVDAGTSILLNGLHIHQAYGSGLVINGGEVECVAVNLAANNQSGGTGYDIDQSGMSAGNARFFGCRLQTSSGTGAGLVTFAVNANGHGYYDNCYFIGGGTQSPSTVFTGTPQRIKNCVGYNPRGSISAPTITSSPFTSNTSQQDVLIIFTAVNSLTAFKIGGTAVGILPVAGVPYFVPARQSLELDYSAAAPTWQWYGC